MAASERHAYEMILAAVAEAERLGIRITHGDWGVIYGELSGEWVVDQKRRQGPGVTPLGAVVLAHQPAGGIDMPHPAAEVLGVRIAWAEGFSDGFDAEASAFFLGSADRHAYLDGLEAGMELRFALTVRCDVCYTRHFRANACPLCLERQRPGEAA